jgi:hypothetical protein
MICTQKEGEMVELLFLLSLLAVLRMRSEHTRMMSKNADNNLRWRSCQHFTLASSLYLAVIYLLFAF